MLGIGRSLRSRGHDVAVFDQGEYEIDVVRTGLQFVPLCSGSACQRTFERARGSAQLLAGMIRRIILPNALAWVDHIRQAGPFDGIVAHHFQYAAQLAAEVLDIPFISVAGCDIAELYYPGQARATADGAAARRHLLAIDRLGTGPLNAIRQQLGLAERSRASTVGTLESSGVVIVCPRPLLPPTRAWPRRFRIAGYPWYDGSDNFELPAPVEEFVRRQDLGPLIVCSLGDAWAKEYPQTSVNFTRVAERRGYRVLYLLCRGRIAMTSERALAVPFAPLSKVLPHARLLVHSAGRGTLVNGIRKAVPSLMIPQWLDCYENARKATQLGIGKVVPRELELDEVDAELADVLGDPSYVERTRAVAAAMAQDPDAGAVADELIAEALESGSGRRTGRADRAG
jgi:rhamnosyltransferase subunit B